jgi:hypothetical protein
VPPAELRTGVPSELRASSSLFHPLDIHTQLPCIRLRACETPGIRSSASSVSTLSRSRSIYRRRFSTPSHRLARTRSPRKLPYVNKGSSLQPSSSASTTQERSSCGTLQHQLNTRAYRNTSQPVYTSIDTATAPHHCTRPRLETKGNRGLVPTTARAGFGAHLQ